jgi:tetratricopeptide (TPR) repeat protein
MAIDDPTAIPETPDQIEEYVTAAGQAFDTGDSDRAFTLYWAVIQSDRSGDHRDLILYRMALIEMGRGNPEEAYRLAHSSHHPGAADLVRSADNATPDQAVDPNRVPATAEEAHDYTVQADHAVQTGDLATALALYGMIVQCTDLSPNGKASAEVAYAELLHRSGRDEEARQWVEAAVGLAEGDYATRARSLIATLGGPHVTDDNPYDTEGSRALLAGIEFFQSGVSDMARAELTTALNSDTSTAQDKGRAAYYLGSMDHHAGHFATARDLLHQAQRDAPAPEQAWAADMLTWEWQESAQP